MPRPDRTCPCWEHPVQAHTISTHSEDEDDILRVDRTSQNPWQQVTGSRGRHHAYHPEQSRHAGVPLISELVLRQATEGTYVLLCVVSSNVLWEYL